MQKSSFLENKRVLRIKTMLSREGLKQKDLAEALDMEPQNLSRCMVSGKITDKMCQKIVEKFPEYRIEWLLGNDDSMTDYDWAENRQKMRDIVAQSIWGLIENSLNKDGKSLKFVHRAGQHLDSTQRLHADCYYAIVDRDGNELKRLTALEMVEFEQKLQEYCDFMTVKYISENPVPVVRKRVTVE